MTRRALIPLALLASSACAYYNAMWSAEHLAREARRLEASGREGEARSSWARAAAKAESVIARHPRSRWADDALVLRGEALARSGTCARAAEPLAQARKTLRDGALRERADLAAAQCALQAGDPAAATDLLVLPLESSDAGRRSRAAYLAGQAAAARGDVGGAVALFGRSGEAAAGPARVRALLAAGRVPDATALLDTLGGAKLAEGEWAGLLDDLSRAGGAVEASRALDGLIERARPAFAARARLLLADGDRLLGHGDVDGARARYATVMRVAPASGEAAIARVRRLRTLTARADSPADLAPVARELDRLIRAGTGGAGEQAARALQLLMDSVAQTGGGDVAAFRAAELARDSLRAARLAGWLFLRFAAEQPASLFAPKALVAALPLQPERHDSILAVLDSTYGSSAYTRALRGEPTPVYAAAEDSLAQALGVRSRTTPPVVVGRVSPPLTGPPGPWLEDSGTADSGPGRRAVADDKARRPGPRPVQPPRP